MKKSYWKTVNDDHNMREIRSRAVTMWLLSCYLAIYKKKEWN